MMPLTLYSFAPPHAHPPRCLLSTQAAREASVDTGLMPGGDINGITSANLLTASKDEDLVF